MVDPWLLALDTSSNVVSLAIPAGLWALLFVLAWEHGEFAESLGLGRRAFWLLLPGALLSSYTFLPLAPISNDWVAVSFGGALFPLVVGAFALRRSAPPAVRTLVRLIGYVGIEAAAMLFVVLPVSRSAVARLGVATGLGTAGASVLLVGIIGLAVCAVAALSALGSSDRTDPRVGLLLGVTTGVLLLTFAGSSAIPGVGIVESYPYYLLPPIAAGIAAGLLAPRYFPGEEGFALPSALLAGTLGVLIGADLLREPPLYGHGAGGLYIVGGAGVLDLVYLSGLLALGGAFRRSRRIGPRLVSDRGPSPGPAGVARAAAPGGVPRRGRRRPRHFASNVGRGGPVRGRPGPNPLWSGSRDGRPAVGAPPRARLARQ